MNHKLNKNNYQRIAEFSIFVKIIVFFPFISIIEAQ